MMRILYSMNSTIFYCIKADLFKDLGIYVDVKHICNMKHAQNMDFSGLSTTKKKLFLFTFRSRHHSFRQSIDYYAISVSWGTYGKGVGTERLWLKNNEKIQPGGKSISYSINMSSATAYQNVRNQNHNS